jgi:D-serine deaminase-like pyridoxal phosphate-dependent protein
VTTLSDLDTPALLLDADRLDANLAGMRRRAADLGVALRPHVKTHKSIDVAQRDAAMPGPITVSTLREAEAFFAAGHRDILYAVGIAPHKLDHVSRLRAAGCDLKIVLDNLETAHAVAAFCRTRAVTMPVLLEIDCDGHRSGIKPCDPSLLTHAGVLQQGGALLTGVMTHAGESYNCDSVEAIVAIAEVERAAVVESAAMLRAHGYACPTVSVGSTPTATYARHLDGVTELRAGVYAFFDLVMAGIDVCRIDDIALSVLVTVIGHQRDKGWIVTDGGWMAMSRDRGTAKQRRDCGYGLVCDTTGRALEGMKVSDANQEHGIVSGHATAVDLIGRHPVGSMLRILPNHACATGAQHDRYHVVRGTSLAVVDEWERFRGW